jgi:hypothetical protein
MWDLWWTKRNWGRFSASTSVSLANHSTHRLLHTHHHPSSGAGTIGQTVADVPSGLSLTQHKNPPPPKEKTLNLPVIAPLRQRQHFYPQLTNSFAGQFLYQSGAPIRRTILFKLTFLQPEWLSGSFVLTWAIRPLPGTLQMATSVFLLRLWK